MNFITANIVKDFACGVDCNSVVSWIDSIQQNKRCSVPACDIAQELPIVFDELEREGLGCHTTALRVTFERSYGCISEAVVQPAEFLDRDSFDLLDFLQSHWREDSSAELFLNRDGESGGWWYGSTIQLRMNSNQSLRGFKIDGDWKQFWLNHESGVLRIVGCPTNHNKHFALTLYNCLTLQQIVKQLKDKGVTTTVRRC